MLADGGEAELDSGVVDVEDDSPLATGAFKALRRQLSIGKGARTGQDVVRIHAEHGPARAGAQPLRAARFG